MRISKLHLQDFGQFHDKDISLAPGINVVYGANEAGKSTIKDFIVDMFYGIDKARGIGARFDHYEQKKPINGSAYSGAMEVADESNSYLVERNFSRQEKKTVVRDLDTGREVPLQESNSLIGTLIQTDKSTYMNTLCISQMGAATDKEISDKLNNYIVNMASARTGDIDAVNAIMELKAKKKEFSNKELEQKEQEYTASLALDRDFDAELAAVKDEYAKIEAAMQGQDKHSEQLQFTPIKKADEESDEYDEDDEEELSEYSRKLQEKACKKAAKAAKKAAKKSGNSDQEYENVEDTSSTTYEDIEDTASLTKEEKEIKMLQNMGQKSILDNVFVILLLSLVFMAMFVGIAYIIPVNFAQIRIFVMGFGIALVLLTTIQVLVKRAKLYGLLEEIEIEQSFEEAKSGTMSVDEQREYVNKLSDLKVSEERIMNERKNQENLLTELTQIKDKKAANDIENAALDLAIKTIQDLSEEIYDSFGSVLNEQVSEIISRITSNKYSEVKIDDQLRVMVKSGSSFISMDYLSVGTMEQLYLALRLSIANVLVAEDMPIIMDDIFVAYDYQRLYETLSCLGEYLNRQIIIFTANPGIHDMFKGLGIESNYIAI